MYIPIYIYIHRYIHWYIQYIYQYISIYIYQYILIYINNSILIAVSRHGYSGKDGLAILSTLPALEGVIHCDGEDYFLNASQTCFGENKL